MNPRTPIAPTSALAIAPKLGTMVVLLLIASCGGGGGGGGYSAPPTYSIGGSVANLAAGQQLTLADNGGDSLTVTGNGAFTFKTPVAANAAFSVSVATQPTGQTCVVSGGAGQASANVTNVGVSCSASAYTIGGMVSGLQDGTQAILHDNGADALTISANGAFTFAASIDYGGAYSVTVATQPLGQTCTVAGGSSASVKANVTTVAIN